MILLGDKAFITDEKGQVSYSSLPFGTYTVKAGAQAGWFHTETSFPVNAFREKAEIPLKQAGSVRGSIRYAYDERTAKNFVPVMGGVSIRIYRHGEMVQRAVTDNDGRFIAFLPNGEYNVEMETTALDPHSSVQNKTQTFTVEAGHISTLEPFVVEIRSKKINIRQFVQNSP
ncbi:MAG: prealbumin-like fold domain-containing protein [Leadbetterella sp.]|nr:prealbumin-like fold domain-containing protein [Leadbetterella sp.]